MKDYREFGLSKRNAVRFFTHRSPIISGVRWDKAFVQMSFDTAHVPTHML
jgi:hypothetical protein